MSNDLEKQMAEMLKGNKATITTKAINILAMDIDKKFANVDEKLDNILHLLKLNKHDTDNQIKQLRDTQIQNCKEHKAELTQKFKELDEDVETFNFFKKHPELLKIVGVAILIIIAFLAGRTDLIKNIL